jgi:uncharacterized membrane protein YraQ (UPF0718 family)
VKQFFLIFFKTVKVKEKNCFQCEICASVLRLLVKNIFLSAFDVINYIICDIRSISFIAIFRPGKYADSYVRVKCELLTSYSTDGSRAAFNSLRKTSSMCLQY